MNNIWWPKYDDLNQTNDDRSEGLPKTTKGRMCDMVAPSNKYHIYEVICIEK